MKTLLSGSAAETRAIGKQLAKTVSGGEILGISGPLGAGKTELIKGFAAALGAKSKITSPTFVVEKRHPIKKNNRGLTLLHLDLYRIQNPRELSALTSLQQMQNPNFITIVEWPERAKKLLPANTRYISIGLGKREHERTIRIA